MRIGINTRLLLPGKSDGIGKFNAEIVPRLVRMNPEHEFHCFFDRKVDLPFSLPDNTTAHVLPPPTRHPFLYYLWFEWILPRALKKHRIERFFSPDGFLSLRSSVPSYPVMHDLNFEAYPKDLPFFTRGFYKRYFPRYARTAERIMTVSDHSRMDIAERYGVDPERIDVVYNGVGDSFHPIDEERKKRIRAEWSGGAPYLVQVSTLHPRKNIRRLLLAFDRFCKDRDDELKLLLVGKSMWWTREMEESYRSMEHRERVVFTGHMGEEGLNDLIAASEAVLYLSYFEGFGIPVLEAMKAGVPVLSSDRTSLPEVGGDAVLYSDPFSVDAILERMQRILNDEDLRSDLVEKGLERAREFTWDKVAERVNRSLMKDA